MATDPRRAHLSYVTQSEDLPSSEGDEASEHPSKLKEEGPLSPTNPAKRQKRIHPPSRLHLESELHPSPPSSHGSPRALNEHADVHSLATALPSSEFSCELQVFFDLLPQGQPIEVMLDSAETRWASESFQKVEERAFEQLARSKMTRITHTLYRKSGICKLIRHGEKLQQQRNHAGLHKVPFRHMVDCLPASDQKEWTELWFAINGFRGQYNRDNFHLRVEWNFSGFEILRFGAPVFEIAVRKALASRMKTNWKRTVYLSRTDLDKVFSDDVVQHLIERDMSLQGLYAENSEAKGAFDKADFATQVYTWNSRMLAICVYVDLPLICLWRLWRCGKRDQDLPLPDTIETMCGEHKKEFRDFMQWQGAFIAHMFQPLPMLPDEEDSSGVEIDDGVTLPICFDKLKDTRGQGSYGHVYEAFVEPDHHHYVPGKHVKLALKIFHDYGSQTRADFDRECHMLKEISKMRPHDHVVTHISSFKHDTKFYMLFPLADCNLGDYLNEQTPPSTDRDFVLWLIKQMKGLASAVCYLHRAGKDIVQDALEKKLPPVPSRERTCFHHDLKPENILVFQDEKTGEKVLKISDFGSGRIGKPRTGMKGSYATKDPNTGTPDYEAPDWLLSEKSSRPYDVWSLGCLSLEMLLWAFRLRSRRDFESARFAYRDDELGIGHSPRFWYADAQRRAHLKPAVADSLRALGRHCEDYGVFGSVYKTVRGMFTTSPIDRPKARDVEDDFGAICTQAERDLETNWNFYLTPGQNSTGVAAPVSAVASQPSRSRSPSAEPGSNRFDADLLSPRSAQRANGLRGRAESLPNQEVLQQIGAQRHIIFPDTEAISGGKPTPHGSLLLRTEQVPEVLISDSSMATHDTPFGTVIRDLGSPWSSMQEEVRARLSGSVFEPPEKRQ